MNTIRGTIYHGQISLSAPVNWPDGTEVCVQPVSVTLEDDCLSDTDEHVDDDQSIARWIEEFNAIPPWEMTLEEEALWVAARNAQRELDKARNSRLFMQPELPGQ